MRIRDMMAPREPFPKGTHLAICYGYAYIGIQEGTYKGKPTKPAGKFVLIWEFPELQIEIEDERGSKQLLPRAKSLSYTSSPSDKGKFYQHLQSWKGDTLSPEQMLDYDPVELIGEPCYIQVVHENKDGLPKDKITTITPVRANETIPPLVNPKLVYEYDYNTQTWPPFPENLPEWIKNSIYSSKQWEAQKAREEAAENAQQPQQQPQGNAGCTAEPAQQARQDAPNMFEKQRAQQAQEVPAQVTEAPPEPTPAAVGETPKDDYDPGF